MLFSLSKSFTSTAAGLAVSEGRLSLDDSVVSFFPEQAPAEVSPNLAAMRVRHLLSMSTGHAEDALGRLRDASGGDWARAFLALPVEHAPGARFVYNSGATYMVSAIVQAVSGQTVLDYLRPRLFEPLGIANPTWEASPQGISAGGWGLSITTEDIARFGQLYLQNGVWQGTRLLPEGWVADATSKHVENGTDSDSDWAQGYGYQFWRCRHGAYRGDGAFGQFCVVLPEQDAVVAITAGCNDLGGTLNLVWDHLLPAMGNEALPDDPAAQAHLARHLGALTLTGPQGQAMSPLSASISGRTFAFAPGANNEREITQVQWNFGADGSAVIIHDKWGEHRFEAGARFWRAGRTTFRAGGTEPLLAETHGGEAGPPVAAWGAWTANDTYALAICFCETPFVVTLTARFSDNGVALDLRRNVSFGPTERPPLEGRIADAP